MGLHAEIKPFLKEKFASCFVDEVPGEHVNCQICDMMYVLYGFNPDEHAAFADLAEFLWAPIRAFFRAGGKTFVACFDDATCVPAAKRDTQGKRRKAFGEADDPPRLVAGIPRPWRAGLADRDLRGDLMRECAAALLARFAGDEFSELRNVALVVDVDSTPKRVERVDGGGVRRTELPSRRSGEADVALPAWARENEDRPCVLRVLDSDAIVIALLHAHVRARETPLYLWIRSRQHEPQKPSALGSEPRDILDVLALRRSLDQLRVPAPDFAFFVICQQTDFVSKVVTGLGARKVMLKVLAYYARQRAAKQFLRVSEAEQVIDFEGVLRVLHFAMEDTKRAALVADPMSELSRCWWNVLYWSNISKPCSNFGWDEEGKRKKVRHSKSYFG